MNRIVRTIGVRLLLVIPQLILVTGLVFLLIRLLPGDPATARLGSTAPQSAVEALRHQLGLDLPIHIQYINYMKGLLQGDLGESWRTGQSVIEDLKMRFPATLELLLLSMPIAIIIGVTIGVISAMKPGGLVDRTTILYALLAGALPEFYIAIILIFVFYTVLKIAVYPAGQLDLTIAPPTMITGMYLVDSALTGQWNIFRVALSHLILPVVTISFWQAGAVMKMTRSTMLQILDGEFISYARLVGLKLGIIRRYALRNALPPIISLAIIIFSILFGLIVTIEYVFSWGGLGQYALQSVVSSDYEAISGYLLLASTITLTLFIVLDIIYALIDPRLEL